MDLNEIKVFVKVVQVGSFSEAARQLGMPKSTVSAKVADLESRLGLSLIRRTTRKLFVTDAGQDYFEKCRQGLESLMAAEEHLTQGRQEPQGLLRITAPIDLGATALPPVIAAYKKKYPKVQIEVVLSERKVDLIAEGFDLAVRAGQLKDSSLIAKKLGEVYFAPFASPGYLKTHGTPKHPKELKNHSCLRFAPMGEDQWHLVGPSKTVVTLEKNFLSNDLSIIKSLAVNGNGIALLPTFVCMAEVRSQKLIRILPDWRSQVQPVQFVYPGQKFLPLKTSIFMEMATADLKKNLQNYEL